MLLKISSINLFLIAYFLYIYSIINLITIILTNMKKFTINATYLGELMELLETIQYLHEKAYTFANKHLENYLSSDSDRDETDTKNKMKVVLLFSRFFNGENGKLDFSNTDLLHHSGKSNQEILLENFSMAEIEITATLAQFEFVANIEDLIENGILVEMRAIFLNSREVSIINNGLNILAGSGNSNEIETLRKKLNG